MTDRVKFSTQAAPDLLATMRAIAKQEGRQFQSVLEEAMALLIERKHGARARSHVLEHLDASVGRNHEIYQHESG